MKGFELVAGTVAHCCAIFLCYLGCEITTGTVARSEMPEAMSSSVELLDWSWIHGGVWTCIYKQPLSPCHNFLVCVLCLYFVFVFFVFVFFVFVIWRIKGRRVCGLAFISSHCPVTVPYFLCLHFCICVFTRTNTNTNTNLDTNV